MTWRQKIATFVLKNLFCLQEHYCSIVVSIWSSHKSLKSKNFQGGLEVSCSLIFNLENEKVFDISNFWKVRIYRFLL